MCALRYRADTQVGPYRNYDDTVKMTRHDDKFIGHDREKFTVQFKPLFFNHPARIVQLYCAVLNHVEQTHPVLRADRDKIRPGNE